MSSAVVEISDIRSGRIYAVGDIHGCYDELQALEAKIFASLKRSKLKNYKIVSVGDLCDRGPDTKRVIEHFVSGKNAGTHDVIVGNHEMFFLMAFWGLRPDLLKRAGITPLWFHHAFAEIYKTVKTQVESWSVNGGDAVFRSYDADINDIKTWERVPLSHLQLLFSSPLVVVTPKAIVSHAVIHEDDLESLKAGDDAGGPNQERRVLEAVHRCLWEREFPLKRVDVQRRQVSGHTPMQYVRRETKLGIIQIDTGAVYGKSLTALNLDNFRTTAVPSSFTYKRTQRDPY